MYSMNTFTCDPDLLWDMFLEQILFFYMSCISVLFDRVSFVTNTHPWLSKFGQISGNILDRYRLRPTTIRYIPYDMYTVSFLIIWSVDFVARSMYLRHGWLTASHSILWDAITYPCLRYLLLATTFSSILSGFIPYYFTHILRSFFTSAGPHLL